MKKSVSKKIIQEAIKAELSKQPLNEGPLDMGILDAPSRAVGAVGNMFSNIGGQMKLGAINKQLDRTAQRIEVDWKKAEDVATKLASKMGSARNPQVRASGQQAAQNIQSAGSDIKNATNKLRAIASTGVDKSSGGAGVSGEESDFQDRVKTDEFGLQYVETPVERWVKSFGGDYQGMGKSEKNHMNRAFLDLRSAGINPFKVPKDKQALLMRYAMNRMEQIAATGEDPYPNFEHFEKVLGKKFADEMRKNAGTLDQEQDDDEKEGIDANEYGSEEGPNIPEFTEKLPLSPELKNFVKQLNAFAEKQGVRKDKRDEYFSFQLQKILPNLPEHERMIVQHWISQFGPKKAPVNHIGGGLQNFSAQQSQSAPQSQQNPVNPSQANTGAQTQPVPLVNKKGQLPGLPTGANTGMGTQPVPLVNKKPFTPSKEAPHVPPSQWDTLPQIKGKGDSGTPPANALKPSPIRAVGKPLPSLEMPAQQIGEPVQLPKMADFFGGDVKPASEEELAQLPVPPDEKSHLLQQASKDPGGKAWKELQKKYPSSPKKAPKELKLADAMPQPGQIPVQDMGDKVEAGSVDQPAFGPPPTDKDESKPARKRVSAKKKR